MRLILSSFASAALALLASGAPTTVVTKDLPTRFAMYVVTAEPRANGLRIRYAPGNLLIDINAAAYGPSADAVFLSSNGHIGLDSADKAAYLGFTEGVSQLRVATAGTHTTIGQWVQDANGVLRIVDAAGVVQPNGVRLCGVGSSVYAFWWDPFPYLNCAVAEFRVVAL